MCRNHQFPTMLGLALLVCSLSPANPALAQDAEAETTRAALEAYSGSMTLALSSSSPFTPIRNSWCLSVNSAGQAQLTINTVPLTTREFDVSETQFSELRRLLAEENFFALGNDYGQVLPDSSYQTITITVGEFAKAVTLRYLANYRVAGEWDKLREPARALRVWLAIRSWFDDAKAHDGTGFHRMTLDALAEVE